MRQRVVQGQRITANPKDGREEGSRNETTMTKAKAKTKRDQCHSENDEKRRHGMEFLREEVLENYFGNESMKKTTATDRTIARTLLQSIISSFVF